MQLLPNKQKQLHFISYKFNFISLTYTLALAVTVKLSDITSSL